MRAHLPRRCPWPVAAPASPAPRSPVARSAAVVAVGLGACALHVGYRRRRETYDYDEVSSSGLRQLSGAKNLAAAHRACRSGVLRSINPKRRGHKSRKHRGGKLKSRRVGMRRRRAWKRELHPPGRHGRRLTSRANPERRGRPGKPWHVSEHGRSGKGYRSRKWRRGNRVVRKSLKKKGGPWTHKKSPRRARR